MKGVLILIILLAIPIATAIDGHMPLLAVKEVNNTFEGSYADLYLEIAQGKGRVFLETQPLTKFDTQLSTRLSKEIACSYLDIECSNFDFIYTISADSPIIGGPSAGAASTLLTISLLRNINIDSKIAITGTINSGGLIGIVGGLKEKIEAGSEIGLKKILIPYGTRIQKDINIEITLNASNKTLELEETNESIDLVEYGKELGVEVIEVVDIDGALQQLNGKIASVTIGDIKINKEYSKIMKYLALDLCNRSNSLRKSKDTLEINDISEDLILLETSALNLTEKGEDAFDNDEYYSSASFCFGANVKYTHLILQRLDMDKSALKKKIEYVRSNIEKSELSIGKISINTITDLESYMIVRERLIDAKQMTDLSLEDINSTNRSISLLAYAIERLYSAHAWSTFFNKQGKEFVFNNKILESSCRTKLSETEERFQYINLFFSQELKDTKEELNNAYTDLRNKDFELCLFKASKAKAEVNSILSLMGVSEENLDIAVEQKINAAKKSIIKEIRKGNFPILAYSYFEYANTLKDSDKFSSMLYSEYALELSNLDLYFKEKNKIRVFKFDEKIIYSFILGLLIGSVTVFTFTKKKKTKRKLNKKRKK